MTARLGTPARSGTQAASYGERIPIGDVAVTLYPAGHVLGSAQVLIEWQGVRVVVSGDYKRAADPTCPAFELVPCDLFITEATFALPVFQHGDVREAVAKLRPSRAHFPDRCHVVGG
jgi:putative mRNA 3-end processing factor